MFPKVSAQNDLISVDFSVIDQLINFKPGGIRFTKTQVDSVEVGPQVLKQIRGVRAPGTYAYFIIAGTYWTGLKKRSFWNAKRKYAANTIRINLKNHKYDHVVIQVADPKALETQLLN
ncbi:MAG: hypothetical protein RLZZ571_688 [Actinomycetota bacterium]|jgi:hypothetical protein